MPRQLRLGPLFAFSRADAGVVAGTPRGRRLGAALMALASAESLPGPLDVEHELVRGQSAWVRRVTSENLWLLYRFDDVEVRVLAVSAPPP
jgi:hypothetical protein